MLSTWQKNCKNIYIFYFQIFNNGALPQTPLTFLFQDKKVSKKINFVEAATLNINQINLILFSLKRCFQDCAHFTRKTYARKAEIVQTHSDEIRRNSNKDDF